MGKNKEKLNIFLLHFLERLNSNEPNERKVIESLTDFCNYYDFTKGFIYQTDGFRYFLLTLIPQHYYKIFFLST